MFVPAPIEIKPIIEIKEINSIEINKKYEINKQEKDPYLEKIFEILFEELKNKDPIFKP